MKPNNKNNSNNVSPLHLWFKIFFVAINDPTKNKRIKEIGVVIKIQTGI